MRHRLLPACSQEHGRIWLPGAHQLVQWLLTGSKASCVQALEHVLCPSALLSHECLPIKLLCSSGFGHTLWHHVLYLVDRLLSDSVISPTGEALTGIHRPVASSPHTKAAACIQRVQTALITYRSQGAALQAFTVNGQGQILKIVLWAEQ